VRPAAALAALVLLAGCTGSSTPSSPAATSPAAATSEASVSTGPSGSGSASPTPSAISTSERPTQQCAAAIVDDMTLRERAGQLVMVGVTTASAGEVKVLKAQKIGSVILMGRHADGVAGVRRVVLRLTWKGQNLPLLVATDQEGGLVQRLRGKGFDTMPSPRVQATWKDSTLESYAGRWGRQLAAAGVTWTLAPVADVVPADMTSSNAPIGALRRGYGSKPGTVADKVSAFVRGMRASGVATSAKHFPGIGRVTGHTDFTAGVVDRVTTADDPYLHPFRAAVEARTASLMVSTVTYTRIDAKHPAVFSRAVIGLIRDKLGFDGVVISDDPGAARSVAGVSAKRRGIDFVRAGGDIAITVAPNLAASFVQGIVSAADDSEPVAAQVRQAAIRVLTMKIDQGLVPCR
jgi:beta-N-acetylhexosaminidase